MPTPPAPPTDAVAVSPPPGRVESMGRSLRTAFRCESRLSDEFIRLLGKLR